jgi:hypothetical protein
MRGGRATMHLPVRGVEPKPPTPHNYMPLPGNFVFVPKKKGGKRQIKPSKQVVVDGGAIKVVAQQGSAAARPPQRRREEPRGRTERSERTERSGDDNKLARAAAVDKREGGPAKARTPPPLPPRRGLMNRVSAALVGQRPRGVVSTANEFNNPTHEPYHARGASTRPQSGNLRNLAGAFEQQQEHYGGGGGEQGFGGMQEQPPHDFGAQQFNDMGQGGGCMPQDQQAPPEQQQQQYTGPDPFANEPQQAGFFSRMSTALGFGGAQQASPPPQQPATCTKSNIRIWPATVAVRIAAYGRAMRPCGVVVQQWMQRATNLATHRCWRRQ